MGTFELRDKVRAKVGCCDIPPGAIGTIHGLDCNDETAFVDFGKGARWVFQKTIELVGVEPACAAKVCGTECAELRARHRELKSELLEAQDQMAALGEERDALRGELGDAKGAADTWRIRAERAEKALDMLRGRK